MAEIILKVTKECEMGQILKKEIIARIEKSNLACSNGEYYVKKQSIPKNLVSLKGANKNNNKE